LIFIKKITVIRESLAMEKDDCFMAGLFLCPFQLTFRSAVVQ